MDRYISSFVGEGEGGNITFASIHHANANLATKH